MEIKIIIATIVALAVGLVIGYPILLLMRRLKAGQQILSYVDKHKSKAGTPTMGGWIFIWAISICGLAFFWKSKEVIVAICGMIAYGCIGFLDIDSICCGNIKQKYQRNYPPSQIKSDIRKRNDYCS